MAGTGGGKPGAKGWRIQKRVAEWFDWMNVGSLGGEDVGGPLVSCEVKAREKMPVFLDCIFARAQTKQRIFLLTKTAIPKYLTNAFDQAVRNNKRKKVPIVFWHEMKRPLEDDYVYLAAEGFEKLFSWSALDPSFNLYVQHHYHLFMQAGNFKYLIDRGNGGFADPRTDQVDW